MLLLTDNGELSAGARHIFYGDVPGDGFRTYNTMYAKAQSAA
jgi:hypothetical protein